MLVQYSFLKVEKYCKEISHITRMNMKPNIPSHLHGCHTQRDKLSPQAQLWSHIGFQYTSLACDDDISIVQCSSTSKTCQYAISKLPCASVSKRVLVQSLS